MEPFRGTERGPAMKLRMSATFMVLVFLGSGAQAQDASTSDRSVPKEKQTSLGLYLRAGEAYEKWKADPKQVKILDVRTPEEYVFVGHPAMAWNVPLKLQTYEWDASGRKLPMKPNPSFVAQVKELFKPSDTILVICRSGGRSAQAVNLLAEAGFKQVYTIVDGMEGDAIDDPESVFNGKRMKNGWKNSGLPWTCDLDPEKMRLPTTQTETRPTQP
jgi:rhodanese-related sulfurtransferase